MQLLARKALTYPNVNRVPAQFVACSCFHTFKESTVHPLAAGDSSMQMVTATATILQYLRVP